MNITPWLDFYSSLAPYSAAEWVIWVTLCLVLAHRKAIHAWPFMFATALLHVVGSPLLYVLHPHYAAYFYTYWTREAVLAISRMMVIGDILHATPGIAYLPKRGRRSVALVAGLIALLSIAVTAWEHQLSAIMPLAVMLNLCANITWAICSLAAIMYVVGCGFAFPTLPWRIGTGYVLMIGLGVGTAWCFASRSRALVYRGTLADSAGNGCILLYWIWSLYQKDDLPSPQLLESFPDPRSFKALPSQPSS